MLAFSAIYFVNGHLKIACLRGLQLALLKTVWALERGVQVQDAGHHAQQIDERRTCGTLVEETRSCIDLGRH
jgi:hypothetical protein